MFGKHRFFLFLLFCFIYAAILPTAVAAGDATTLVEVVLCLDDESALPCLRVSDEAGKEYPPAADTAGTVQYGHYLLEPGKYLYTFHDESGRYEDFENTLDVGEAVRLYVPIDLTPVIEIDSLSFTFIDPIYEDVLTPADIPAVSVDREAVQEEFRELATVLTNNPKRLRARSYWNEHIYFDTMEEAALDLRDHIKAFDSSVMVRFTADASLTESQLETYFMDIWYMAIAHTGVPTEGDYLRYEHGGYRADMASTKLPEGYDGAGRCYNIVWVNLNNFTDAQQEAALDQVVDDLLVQLQLDSKSDFQKVLTIYDYLCTNVTYDNVSAGNLKRTAYAALINHTAVCQGYAAAFYRLCLSVGVDTRMITCSAISHAWNIVRLNGLYYELDTTWDSQKTPAAYDYFLKGSNEWPTRGPSQHGSIGDQYAKSPFADAYPLSADSVPIVTFTSSGGIEIMPQYVLTGEKAVLPVVPVYGENWLVGWYRDSSFDTRYDFDTQVTEDLTLYARWAAPDLVLPDALTDIGDEAFLGGVFTFALLPEQAVSIGPRAFADCKALICVYIPEETVSIDPSAFDGTTGITVFGTASSEAENYADEHNLAFMAVPALQE